MNKTYLLLLPTIIWLAACTSVKIDEDLYEERPHFVIYTPSATYWYDKSGGGLSRMIDSEGNDWINFKKEPFDEYPAAAAGGFRGMPNFVFRSEEGGAGHPGFDQCRSEVIDGNKIRTISHSGKWQWTWTFREDHARVSVEKVDSEHAYWFLYEGTPGGKFIPNNYYWGTDQTGYQTELPDYYAEERITGNWQWAYFGNRSVNRVLFVGMQKSDRQTDLIGFLGNTEAGLAAADGMVVFGFGRQPGAVPLMTRADNVFYVGFLETKVSSSDEHEGLARQIQHHLNEE